jgi:4-aminobutyrate aminotransferase-like enzyme
MQTAARVARRTFASAADVRATLDRHIHPGVYRPKDAPVPVSSQGSWLVTAEKRRVLDFATGIAVASTGHAHPHVVDAIKTQAAKGALECTPATRLPLTATPGAVARPRQAFTGSRT